MGMASSDTIMGYELTMGITIDTSSFLSVWNMIYTDTARSTPESIAITSDVLSRGSGRGNRIIITTLTISIMKPRMSK